MTGSPSRRRPARLPAAADLDAELGRIAAMTIDELRDLWRATRRREPPEALTKDLIARALAHFLQDERLGGLRPDLRKLLASRRRLNDLLAKLDGNDELNSALLDVVGKPEDLKQLKASNTSTEEVNNG